MNVILDLDKNYLDKFQELADQDRRSRKNFMESVLINYLNGNNPIVERNGVPREKVDNSAKIAELEKELSEIPDKTKGIGKSLAASLTSRINKLKYNQ